MGIEANAGLSRDFWSGDFGLTWMDAENSEGEPLEYRPTIKATLSLKLVPISNLHLRTDIQYVRGMQELVDDSFIELPDHLLSGASLEYRIPNSWQPVSIGIGAENILDVDYREGGGPMPGRFWRLYLSF